MSPIPAQPRQQSRTNFDVRTRITLLEDDEDDVRRLLETGIADVMDSLEEMKRGQKKILAWTYGLLTSIITALAVQLLLLK